MGHARTCSLLLGVVGAVLLGRASAETEQLSPASEPLLAIRLDGAAGQAVRRAVLGARRRLADPACRQVLTDFRDDSGRPLAGVLSDLSVSAADYLGLPSGSVEITQGRCLKRPNAWPVFDEAPLAAVQRSRQLTSGRPPETTGTGGSPSGESSATEAAPNRRGNSP